MGVELGCESSESGRPWRVRSCALTRSCSAKRPFEARCPSRRTAPGRRPPGAPRGGGPSPCCGRRVSGRDGRPAQRSCSRPTFACGPVGRRGTPLRARHDRCASAAGARPAIPRSGGALFQHHAGRRGVRPTEATTESRSNSRETGRRLGFRAQPRARIDPRAVNELDRVALTLDRQ